MKYKVEAVAFFDDPDDAAGAMNDAWEWLLKGVNINCGTEMVEVCFCEKGRCYHDEDPHKPCVVDERHEKECP